MLTLVALLVLGILAGIFMAVFIAMGATLGCRALSLKKIIILAAIFELIGSILLGGFVAQTLSSGLLKPPTEQINEYQLRQFMLAMVCVLIGSGLWLCIATLLSLPVSTTHSVIGSIIGCGVYMNGWNSVDWMMMLKISISWVASPIIGGIVSALCWYPLKRFTFNSSDPASRVLRFLPTLAGTTTGILALFILYKGLSPLKVEVPIYIALPCAIVLGALFGVGIWKLVMPRLKKRIDEDSRTIELEELHSSATDERASMGTLEGSIGTNPETESQVNTTDGEVRSTSPIVYKDIDPAVDNEEPVAQFEEHDVEQVREEEPTPQLDTSTKSHDQVLITEKHAFNFLVIVTSCCIATAHGANDISNAAGPLGAIVWTYMNEKLPDTTTRTEIWVTVVTAAGLVLGLATLGYRVMMTIGDKITKLTPARAYVAQLVTAFLTLTASILGLPLSTTHIIVGAVYGISIVDIIGTGTWRDLQWKMLTGIVLSWVITIPASSVLSLFVFFLLRFAL